MASGGRGALPQTCDPTARLWAHGVLYAGPALELAPHAPPVWCLVVGVDGPVRLHVGGDVLEARSALISPRTTHRLQALGTRIVSCYLDPLDGRVRGCQQAFDRRIGGVSLDHRREGSLCAPLADDASVEHWLGLAAPKDPPALDPRIERVVRGVHDEPATARAARLLAAESGVSESYFLHLFSAEVGTSLRRYRIWARLLRCARAVARGCDLTTAAIDAGFASPSHFADRFKDVFGLSATTVLGAGLAIREMSSPQGFGAAAGM